VFPQGLQIDNIIIISWRTVAAFRKQSCGLFLAATAAAVPRGCRSVEKKRAPRNREALWISDNLIISWRTVAAFRKQSCGLFLAATVAAVPRGCRSVEKKRAPRNREALWISDNLIISWRTAVRDGLP